MECESYPFDRILYDRRFRWLRVLGVLIVVAAGYALLAMLLREAFTRRPFASLDAGKGRSIQMFAPDTWVEGAEVLTYEIRVDGDIVVPETSLMTVSGFFEKITFELLFAQDGNVVGVVDSSAPDELLIIHDFSSGESWSFGSDSDNPGRKPRLLRVLQDAHPDRTLR